MNYVCTAFLRKKHEKMGKAIETWGLQQADNAIGAALGFATANWQDRRQLRQQRALTDMQYQANKELMEHSFGLQHKMWKDTNYSAQMDELRKAGLNPALLYGMSGGGGVTTGSGSANVSGGHAAGGSGEVLQGAGMGLQAGMMRAQKELIESQVDLNKAEADKKRGVDTDKTSAEIDNLLQQYDNLRNVFDLQNLEKSLKNLDIWEKTNTVDENIKQAKIKTQDAINNLVLSGNEAKISDATVNDQIKTVKQIAISKFLENELSRGTIKMQPEMLNNLRWRTKTLVEENMRSWDKLNFEEREMRVKELLKDFNTDYNKEAVRQITGVIGDIIGLKALQHIVKPDGKNDDGDKWGKGYKKPNWQ